VHSFSAWFNLCQRTTVWNADASRAGVGRGYARRGVGKMGDEERQPRKGRIYGRKYDGRFASKANVHYHHAKQRRRGSIASPPSGDLTGSETSTSQLNARSSSSSHTADCTSHSQSTSGTQQRNIITNLQLNLQPRVDLTKAIVRGLSRSRVFWYLCIALQRCVTWTPWCVG